MTRAIRLVPLLVAALVLVGCGQNDNTPESYPDRTLPAEQQGRNDYQVWLNFERSCLEANSDLSERDAREVCECIWDAYVEDVPFEVFIAFDRAIRERIGTVGNNRAALEVVARNVVGEYNRQLGTDEAPLRVDLLELMEGCAPSAA